MPSTALCSSVSNIPTLPSSLGASGLRRANQRQHPHSNCGHHWAHVDSSDRKVNVKQERDRHLSDHSFAHSAPLWAQCQGSVTEKSHLTTQKKMRWWYWSSKVQLVSFLKGPFNCAEAARASSPPSSDHFVADLFPKVGKRWPPLSPSHISGSRKGHGRGRETNVKNKFWAFSLGFFLYQQAIPALVMINNW